MIRYEIAGEVARIVLDTPQTSNRFTYSLMLDFIAALTEAAHSGATVLVLSATGKDFTLGRDQTEKLTGVSRKDSLALILRANEQLRRFPGVSIALVQGRCMGFGTGLALHCDITIGAHDAILGFDEIRHGLAPLVVLIYLPQYVGPKVAKELVLTGRDVPAEEARSLGLLNHVAPEAGLAEAGEALAARLSGFSAGALRLIQSFSEELPSFKGSDPGAYAIDRLVKWIEAGKP